MSDTNTGEQEGRFASPANLEGQPSSQETTTPEPSAPSGSLGEDDAFVDMWLQDYATGRFRDEELWSIFAESFAEWGKDRFAHLGGSRKNMIRKTLRENGVWVKQGGGIHISKSLSDVKDADTSPEWPVADVESQIKSIFNSWRNYLVEDRAASIEQYKQRTQSTTGTPTPAPAPKTVTPAVTTEQETTPTPEPRQQEPSQNPGRGEVPVRPTPANAERWGNAAGYGRPSEGVGRNFPQTKTESGSDTRVRLGRTELYEATPDHEAVPSQAYRDMVNRKRYEGPEDLQFNLYRELPSTTPKPELRPTQLAPPQATFGYDHESLYGEDPKIPLEVSKALGQLSKVYSKEMKYRGSVDSFDRALVYFHHECRTVLIGKEHFHLAFPTMLADMALEFFFDYVANSGVSFDGMKEIMRVEFETKERARRIQLQWDQITFSKVANSEKARGKDLVQIFELLQRELRKLQLGLRVEKRGDDEIREKLFQAMFGVQECDLAIYSGAPTFHMACDSIRRSLALRMELNASSAYVAENSNHSRGPCGDDDCASYYADRKLNYSNDNKRGTGNARPPGKRGKCWIDGKENCWSGNHTKEERDASYQKWKEAQANKTKASIPQYKAFLASYEDHGLNGYDGWDWVDEYDLSFEEDIDHQHFMGTLSIDDVEYDGALIMEELSNQSAEHAFTREAQNGTDVRLPVESFMTRYNSHSFMGVLLDTGAARSTGGLLQFQALKRIQNVELDATRAGEARFKFGIGQTVSLGVATVRTPIGAIEFHIVDADVPFLMSLKDLDDNNATYDNLRNVLVQGKSKYLVVRKHGHPWLLLDPTRTLIFNSKRNLFESHLTEVELRTIHRRFGHPSINRLKVLLDRSGHDVESPLLQQIANFCEHCQKHGGAPGRFKFTLKDDIEFNHTVIVDIVDLEGKSTLHVVDEATAFNSARFVRSMSAEHAWEALRACWIDVYQGPPDYIVHDPGTNFHSREFRDYARSVGSQVHVQPVESHNSVGKVERYHAPLRRAYNILGKEMPSLPVAERLQMAVKAVNDTAGPNGLVPTLLVFGAYPRMVETDPPSPTVAERAVAIRKAMDEVRRIHATRQVREAVKARNGPNTGPIHDLALNSEVLVWREGKGWDGPAKLVGRDGETCLVQFNTGQPRSFRTTKIKPFHRPRDDMDGTVLPQKRNLPENDNKSTCDEIEEPPSDNPNEIIPPAHDGPSANTRSKAREAASIEEIMIAIAELTEDEKDESCPWEEIEAWLTEKEMRDMTLSKELREKGIIKTPGDPFTASRQAEIDGLLARGVFKLIHKDDPSIGNHRIFGSRMVDEVKGKETALPYEKSRLVIQAFNDQGKKEILTQSPTIQRVSQRMLLCIAASLRKKGMSVSIRDITQAYIQAITKLQRKIFARPPKEMIDELPPGTLFEVILPLYGIPEAGNHWFNTYYKHHLNKLMMETSTYDPCLLITKEGEPFGMVGMQTDDTLILGDEAFLAKEDRELKEAKLLAKDTETLSEAKPLQFNGCVLTLKDDCIFITQKGQGKRIEEVPLDDPSSLKQSYMQQRARGAYIASICQPEATFDLSVAAQHHDPTPEEVKLLNKRLKWQKGNLDRGLRYVAVDLSVAKLFIFVDASFANNKDLSSQIGYVIVFGIEVWEDGRFVVYGNIIHFSSTKCKRVTRAVLASELYAMAGGVDVAISLNATLKMVAMRLGLGEIPSVICTDSLSLYECIVKLGTTKEKRLMIDIMSIRQSYERRELSEVRWIDGDSNPADAMTKSNCNKALEQLVDTNTLKVKVQGWVQRPKPSG